MQETSRPRPSATGVYAALATPRRAGSIAVDTAALLDYSDAIAGVDVDGLVLFGSTGEFVHLGIEERSRAAALAIRRSRIPVLVNVSHSSLSGAVELAESAVDSGAAGILLMPPYFYRYADAQLFEFYRQFTVAFQDRLPIYLYNLPASTTPISATLAAKLFETGSFAGIKDSSGDRDHFGTLQELRQNRSFRLIAGHERLFRHALETGADGVISGVAAAVPELIVALNRAIQVGANDQVELLDARLQSFLEYVNRFPTTAIIRQAAVLRGWNLKDCAVPFDDDLAADLISFHSWFRAWLPQVLEEASVAASQTAGQRVP